MAFSSSFLSTAAVAVAFAAGIVVSKAMDDKARAERVQADNIGPATDQTRPASSSAPLPGGALPDLSAVAERAVQASVNISSTQQVRVNDPFFQLFYGQDRIVPRTSLGSGVFVSDGYVVTNSHVVQTRRAEIHVTLADNRELPAKVIGIDPYTDLAVLQVAAKGMAPMPWGDSDKLRVAEWVLAVGNPFAFNQTVTLGIVSARNRPDPQQAAYFDFIQTDAAINPGNSGGALVNSRGELVGINTMIYSETGGYQGIGFAVPANLARRTMTELIKNGEVVRGTIGNLGLRTINADQARRAELGDQGGVLVESMTRYDPAYQAGVLPEDIIIGFNGTAITERSQLQRLITDAAIGSTANVEVIRRGTKRTFRVPVRQMATERAR